MKPSSSTWVVLIGLSVTAACGRIGFDAPSDVPITHVAPFVGHNGSITNTDTFVAQAHAVGNAIAIQLVCVTKVGGKAPTTVTASGAGWTFEQLGPITSAGGEYGATVVAIAPNTESVTITVTWDSDECTRGTNELGDEFAGADPTGGAVTFDGFAAVGGAGTCEGQVRAAHANDAVWGSCDLLCGFPNGLGPGFSPGADDTVMDFAEYRISTDPAGTLETVSFDDTDMAYVLSMVTIKPAD